METKKKNVICQRYSGFTHKTNECRLSYTYKVCNRQHLNVLHNHQRGISCSLRGRITAASMAMQGIEVKLGP